MEQPPTPATAPATTPATAAAAGPAGVDGVVAAANGLLRTLDQTLWAARESAELVATVAQLETLRAVLAAVEVAAVAELAARQVPKRELGWASTADWFTHTAGVTRREGHRLVRQAATLVGDRAATHRALAAGRVSPEQAAVIVDAVDQLPRAGSVRARGERALLEQAGHLDATELAKTGRHLAHVADPDRTERRLEAALDREDRAAHHGRFLALTEDGAGGIRLRGRGTVEDAAVIKAALLPLTKPAPAPVLASVDPAGDSADPDPACGEETDPRDHGARLWDALVQACQHALATDLPADSHGARPRLTVTIDLDTLRGRPDQHTHPGQTDPGQTDPGQADPGHLDDGRIDWTALAAGAGSWVGGVTEDGLELTPAVVRRLACDADLIPVALGTAGEVLDVGRTRRLVTPALWRALVCRDRHCAFPGCTRPPVTGHAHHLVHWAHGGRTSLSNLVLLCGHHHRTLHHTPWQVRLNPGDHRPEFLPPPRPGRPPTWIRTRPRHE